jgi:heme exporter protein C
VKTGRLLGWVAAIGLLSGLSVGFLYAPRDAVQGNVQRIMYLHVPSVLTGYLAFGVVFLASLAYLFSQRSRWDRLAAASAEVGVVFTGLTLVSGAVWGKPTWGTWWTWDARLTTTALLFLIYVSYLLVRGMVEDRERAARFSAVVGIIGAIDIPIIHFSVQWFRTLHQPATLLRPQAPTMDAPMVFTLLLNVGAFILFYVYLTRMRFRLAELEEGV